MWRRTAKAQLRDGTAKSQEAAASALQRLTGGQRKLAARRLQAVRAMTMRSRVSMPVRKHSSMKRQRRVLQRCT